MLPVPTYGLFCHKLIENKGNDTIISRCGQSMIKKDEKETLTNGPCWVGSFTFWDPLYSSHLQFTKTYWCSQMQKSLVFAFNISTFLYSFLPRGLLSFTSSLNIELLVMASISRTPNCKTDRHSILIFMQNKIETGTWCLQINVNIPHLFCHHCESNLEQVCRALVLPQTEGWPKFWMSVPVQLSML